MIIVDTGPLVALLDRHDPDHGWAKETIATVPVPLMTCEAVVTETAFLVSKSAKAVALLFEMIQSRFLVIDFSIMDEAAKLQELMLKYHDLPMSLADACLVRMAEIHQDHRVLTIDSHFRIYRRDGRAEIPVVMPG